MNEDAGSRDAPEPPWLKPFDHTADAGFVVTAGTAEELFSRAAWGMFSLLSDLRAVAPRERRRVTAAADDQPALLVRWLSELNFLHTTGLHLFSRFDVQRVTGTRVEAEVWGEPVDPGRHTVFTEIKAVTFHGLRVERDGDVWTARVLFDV